MKRFRKLGVGIGLGLLLICGAWADELQLVNPWSARGVITPLYVRQPSGSYEAQQRGTLIGQPIELYEETRCVVVRPGTATAEPGFQYGRDQAVYMAQR